MNGTRMIFMRRVDSSLKTYKKHENIVYHRVHSKKSEEESRRENDRRTREKTRSLRLNAALFPLFIMVPILYPQPPDNCATSREIHESPTTPSSARASNRDLLQTDGVSEYNRWSRPGSRSQASYEKPHTLGLPANCLAIDSTIEPSTRPGPNIKSNMSVYRSPCLVTCKQTIKLIISLATTWCNNSDRNKTVNGLNSCITMSILYQIDGNMIFMNENCVSRSPAHRNAS